jgi:hypothetical protein
MFDVKKTGVKKSRDTVPIKPTTGGKTLSSQTITLLSESAGNTFETMEEDYSGFNNQGQRFVWLQ